MIQLTQMANFPVSGGLRHATSFVIAKKVYVGTGGSSTDIFAQYDPTSDQWTSVTRFGGG